MLQSRTDIPCMELIGISQTKHNCILLQNKNKNASLIKCKIGIKLPNF